MSNIKEDKVSFHIRSDFSDRDAVERHNIERGDSYALRHYILKFMQTVPNKEISLEKYICRCQNSILPHSSATNPKSANFLLKRHFITVRGVYYKKH